MKQLPNYLQKLTLKLDCNYLGGYDAIKFIGNGMKYLINLQNLKIDLYDN